MWYNPNPKPCQTKAVALCSKQVEDPRYALFSRQQRLENAVKTLCNRLERHTAAFILNMLKTKNPFTPEWRPYSVPTAFKTLQNFEMRAVQTPTTLFKRCGDAVQSHRTPCGGVYYAPRKISGEHIVAALSVRPSVSQSVRPSVRPYVPFVSGP